MVGFSEPYAVSSDFITRPIAWNWLSFQYLTEAEGNSSLCFAWLELIKVYTCWKKKTQLLKQMELTAHFSPVPVCCSPAVAKETSFRLGTIFVFVVVLSSQKATCRTIVVSELKLKSVVWMLMNLIQIFFSLYLKKKILLRQDKLSSHRRKLCKGVLSYSKC